jgi:predicted Ser/Thr protein kinase
MMRAMAASDDDTVPAKAPPPVKQAEPAPGFTVAHYRVEGRIGAGGMGVVYRAVDTLLGRPVALKFIATDYAGDAQARERLMREARAASALDHPHIGTVYQVGEHEGRAFIAMAFYDGETLLERIARGPLAVDDAEQIARQLAAALGAAHAAGVLHRDVKPANVMLARDGMVKLLDFGVAKLVDEGGNQLTAEGVLVGTPQYMAPEQLRGERVDARADLWALGAVTYEMLAGAPPFVATGRAALITRVLTGRPQPIGRARAEVPPRLRAFVDALLTPEVARRPATAPEALAILDGKARPRRSRRAWLTAAALGVVVAGAGGGGVLAWRQHERAVADDMRAIPDTPAFRRARELYERAVRDFELMRYADATREFEDAYRESGQPELLFNAAQNYRLQGRKPEAIHFYRLFLEHEPDSKLRGDVEARLKKLAEPGP